MRVRLKANSHTHYSGNYSEKLEAINGLWVEIDPTFLHNAQLNTMPISGVTNVGLRIYQKDIEEIKDDERIGRWRCDYCGSWDDTGKPCPSCDKGAAYMKEFFPGTKRNPKTVQEEVDIMFDDIFQGA